MEIAHAPTDRTAPSDTDSKGTISFSVRLTDKQRELLSRAAEKRGWTITNLLKNAALEKAANILNTSAPNRVDYRGTAHAIADQVFSPRRARRLVDEGRAVEVDAVERLEFVPFDDQQEIDAVEVSPWQMPPAFLSAIRDAARSGGTEFLNLIIEASEAIASRNEPYLPDPIDPNMI